MINIKEHISDLKNKVSKMKSSRNLGIKKAVIKFSPFSKNKKGTNLVATSFTCTR